MKTRILLPGLFLILSGCATLTKTQIESVNQFAVTTSEFSAYPGKIMEELADIRVSRSLYYASTLEAGDQLAQLDEIYSQMRFDEKAAEKVDITFRIIDKYARSLLLLSTDQFEKDISEQAKTFGIGIDSLITLYNSMPEVKKVPAGIGQAVSELLVLGGKQFVRTRQAREIRKFVSEADTLIATMSDNLLNFLQSGNISALIETEERGISREYLNYLREPGRASFESQRDYLALKRRIEGVRDLQEQTVQATHKLRKAHRKLLQEISEKKTLKESIAEIQSLCEEINAIKETIEEIEKAHRDALE